MHPPLEADPEFNPNLVLMLSKARQAGVCCFCRSATNPLLWSHYANSHKGFAIGVDRQLLNKPKDFFVEDVIYEDAVPSLEEYGEASLLTMLTKTKATCWAYEQEVRLVRPFGMPETAGPYKLESLAIKEVIFGLKMTKMRRDALMTAIRGNNDLNHVRFGEMFRTQGRYGLSRMWI